MAEYYAVERSPEYLAHYGIKGMRWGVRRAKESGNSAALDRHYARAQRKLAKLRDKADINKQNKLYQHHKNLAIGDAVGAATSVGLGYGATALSRNGAMSRLMRRASSVAGTPGFHVNIERFNDYRPAAIGTGAGLGVMAIGRGIAAGISRHRMSKKGHEKAVSKVKDWENAMNKAFSGTKYAKGKSKNIAKAYKDYNKFKSDAEDSARTAGLLFGPIGAGIATSRYIKSHPKEYKNYKKSVKKIYNK